MEQLKAPFPWFGGKSKVAGLVWDRFGNVPNYVEPFAGSLAVLLSRPHEPQTETVNDADCVAPATRILRSDMSWVRADEITQGDVLIGFDEHNGEARTGLRAPKRYRRLAKTTVTRVAILRKPSYRLTFDDGTTIVCSADHAWLSGSHKSGGRGWRWVKTASMVCNRKNQRSWVLKVADVVHREETWEAGWIGGMLDGEGSVRVGPAVRLQVSQKIGPVLDQVERLLSVRGYSVTRVATTSAVSINVNGGIVQSLSALMQFRPLRLINNFLNRIENVSLYGRSHRAVGLVKKEFLGEQQVVAIETDCHTFIAEGLASHNCYLANFWRAIRYNPSTTAAWTDWPVNEADLHARHLWLVNQADFRERMKTDPEYYDCRIAGWWVWGLCQWIGSGWCVAKDQPEASATGNAGMGVNRQLPHLGNAGMGVNRKLPHLGNAGRGERILAYFEALAERLRDVRVCCGDWSRVTSEAVTEKHGITGVFLDPPYTEGNFDYSAGGIGGDIAGAVREWAIANGNNPMLRIALCGYDGEHAIPKSWECVAWKARKGYQATDKTLADRGRERIWFSPHCLKPPSLFSGIHDDPMDRMLHDVGDCDWRVEAMIEAEQSPLSRGTMAENRGR